METQRKTTGKLKEAHERIGELDLELRAVKAQLRNARQRGRGRRPTRTRSGIPLAYVDAVERHWGTEAGETMRS